MSMGQIFLAALVNGGLTYVLYKIDRKVALAYVGLILLMMLTVYRQQFFGALQQVTGAVSSLGLAA
jgi:hypothetical protein